MDGTRANAPGCGEAPAGPAGNGTAGGGGGRIVAVPVLSLRAGLSPRLEGEDKAHVARLAQAEAALPPILVERSTMRVIDGMHRLLAASLRGQETVNVEFFEGSAADAFLRAVAANVTHGLPLSLADRRAAAARIVRSHPHLSDRAIGETSGLAARTVAAIRRRCAGEVSQSSTRVGRDGRVRPVSGTEGRWRAAALLAERPEASLREVAHDAGVSPATVRDVRRRLERGEEPAPARRPAPGPQPPAPEPGEAPGGPSAGDEPGAPRSCEDAAGAGRSARAQPVMAPAAVLEKLLRDPSLRHNEHGRQLLRVLQANAVGAQEWREVMAAVPPHCTTIVLELARQYGQMWLRIAQELDDRARIVDPWAGTSAAARIEPGGGGPATSATRAC